MNIIVIDAQGESVPFDMATRFSTDEANNLCIYEGEDADKLRHVFAAGSWREAGIYDVDS